MLGDLEKSPYKGRIITVMDSVHEGSLPTAFRNLGIRSENRVIWTKNGIEHFYPKSILKKVFALDVPDIVIEKDRITCNGITKTKDELSVAVLSHMKGDFQHEDEVERFLDLVKAIV